MRRRLLMKLSGQGEKAAEMKSRVSPTKGQPEEPRGRRCRILRHLPSFEHVERMSKMKMSSGRMRGSMFFCCCWRN